MALFCAAIRRDSVSLLRFPFLSHVQVFSGEISLVCRLKWTYNNLSSHFRFLVIFALLMFVLFVLSRRGNQSSPALFYAVFSSLYSMHRRYLECWQVGFLLLFLTHIVCLSHLWDVRPYASSWVFLFSGSFIEVFLSSTLRMVPSILRGGQLRYLSLWWDFCYVVWFRVVLSFSWICFFIFYFTSIGSVRFNIPKYL